MQQSYHPPPGRSPVSWVALFASGGLLSWGCSVDARSVAVAPPAEQVAQSSRPPPSNGLAPGPSVRCGAGTHLCGSECVSDADPRYCAGACEPCSNPDTLNRVAGGAGAANAPGPSETSGPASSAPATECQADHFLQRGACYLDAIQISAGSTHTCALLGDQSVRCWGSNAFGALGDGTNADAAAPVSVVGLSGVRQIQAGNEQTCALLEDGSVSCWGTRIMGDGSVASSTERSPVRVNAVADAVAVVMDSESACALSWTGSVSCWGRYPADVGSPFSFPTRVAFPDGDIAVALAVRGVNACAVLKTGQVKCWQTNAFIAPADVGFEAAVGVTVGPQSICAWNALGELRCRELSGTAPPTLASGFGAVSAAATGQGMLCAIDRESRNVECQDSTPDDTLDLAVDGLGEVSAISAGLAHACALRTDGSVWCWGDGVHGELGDGTKTSSPTPIAVAGW